MGLEPNDHTMQQVAQVLGQTLKEHAHERREAEKQLRSLVGQENFLVLLLYIVEAQTCDMPVRLSAATFMKNTIKNYWEKVENEPNYIPDADRESIKKRIIPLMCSLPAILQNQISEAVRHISENDFPDNWPNLFDELKGMIRQDDMMVTNGVLKTANSVCKRFRGAYDSDEIRKPLKAILDSFQKPLLELFQIVAQQIDLDAVKANEAELLSRLEALRLMTRIFYSLNWITIPEFFEDHIGEWMQQFEKFLSYTNPVVAYPHENEEAGPIERLQAAILENIHLYSEKYDEEFSPYFGKFVSVTWDLLTKLSGGEMIDQPKYDELATKALTFLGSAVANTMHRQLFEGAETLQQIGDNVVIPNITLRESDEELFEDNPQEYLRKDIEGSDSHTRRRAASDVVKNLRKNFEQAVTPLFLQKAQALLQQYSSAPSANWRAKDTALNLISALAIKGESKTVGVTSYNEQIDVIQIMQQYVVPELQGNDIQQKPNANQWETSEAIVKASCIRYIMTFRNQLTGEMMSHIVPLLTEYLKAPVYVLYSYAAAAVERFLILKSSAPTEAWSLRIPQATVHSVLQSALGNALHRMISAGSSGQPQGTGAESVIENEYVMRCVMRLLVVADKDIAPNASEVLQQLTTVLERIATNPRNPTFNHYLFESLTLLIRGTCKASPNAADEFERLLLPPFNTILQQEITEFVTYVFQVLAALLLCRSPAASGTAANDQLSEGYKTLFPALLRPEIWSDRGKYPALVTLLHAYIKHAPQYVAKSGYLDSVLGIFQKLISSVASEEQGFRLLNAVIKNFDTASLGGRMTEIFRILLHRMQKNTTIKFARQFIRTLGLTAVAHGGQAVVSAVDNVQAGLFHQILDQVVHRNIKNIRGKFARKTIVLGLCSISANVEELQSLENVQATLIECSFRLLEGQMDVKQIDGDKRQESELHAAEQAEEEEHFSAQYSRLKYAVDPSSEAHPIDPDYFPVHDAVSAFRQTLHLVRQKTPRAFELLLSSLGHQEATELRKYYE